MKEFKDIKDDQIRIIGEGEGQKTFRKGLWIVILLAVVLLVAGIVFFAIQEDEETPKAEGPIPVYFEPVAEVKPIKHGGIGNEVDSLAKGFTEIRDTIVNDIRLKIYIPHNAELSLHVGRMDKQDTSVIYTAQAADVRADNGGLVGAFVFKGTPLSWGLSKRDFVHLSMGR